jgi:hypothetical protein
MSRYAPSADWYCVFPSPAQPRFLPQPVGEQILDKDSIISALVDVLEGARSINESAGGRLMTLTCYAFSILVIRRAFALRQSRYAGTTTSRRES